MTHLKFIAFFGADQPANTLQTWWLMLKEICSCWVQFIQIFVVRFRLNVACECERNKLRFRQPYINRFLFLKNNHKKILIKLQTNAIRSEVNYRQQLHCIGIFMAKSMKSTESTWVVTITIFNWPSSRFFGLNAHFFWAKPNKQTQK